MSWLWRGGALLLLTSSLGCSGSTPVLDVVQDASAQDVKDTVLPPVDLVADLSNKADVPTSPDHTADLTQDVSEVTDTAQTADTKQDAASLDLGDTATAPNETAFGSIAGSCGALDMELSQDSGSFFINTYTFSDSASFDPSALDPKPFQRFDGENAGGSSKCTEVMSMQLLVDCEGASIHKTEIEITYTVEGAMTDYIAIIDDQKVGVSVTRAYLGPFVQDYSLEDATALLTNKLNAVQASTQNVSPEDAWVKQILHIWTLNADWAELVEQAWAALDPTIQADTIVLVTVEQNSELIVTDACDD